MFDGGRGSNRGQFDSPTGLAVDGKGNVLVADTNNGRIEKFSPTGTFLNTIGIKGSGYGQLGAQNGIATVLPVHIYAHYASKHVFEKVADPAKFDFNKPVSLGAYVLNSYDPDGKWYIWQLRVDWQRTTLAPFGTPGPTYHAYVDPGPPDQPGTAQRNH